MLTHFYSAQGEKIFYLIQPTQANLEAYERWHEEDAQSEIFLGDLVDHCYRCPVKAGTTLLIPSGECRGLSLCLPLPFLNFPLHFSY